MDGTNETERRLAFFTGNTVKRIAYTILLLSGLYVAFVTAWIMTENRTLLPFMEILTISSAIMIVLFMAELHKASGEGKTTQSLMALILSSCMACITIMNHFLYMTVLNQIFGINDIPSWLLLDGWPSVSKGLECVSWGFLLGLAMLFAADALAGQGSRGIAWTMRGFGILTLAGLIGPILGNMLWYNLSTVGYSMGFLVLSIECVVISRRRNQPPIENNSPEG
jgi:hypothetical protein